MKSLRKLLVVLVAWAYAFQAMAAVVAPACDQVGSHQAAHEVAGHAGETGRVHAGLGVVPHAHDDAVTGDSDCDHCPQCDHHGCSCGDHGCSSGAGITSSARALHEDFVRNLFSASPAVLPPLQPYLLGLIRPPSIS